MFVDGYTSEKMDVRWKRGFDSSKVLQFSIWLRNRLISGGLEPVLSHTEKLCKASYYIHVFYGYKNVQS